MAQFSPDCSDLPVRICTLRVVTILAGAFWVTALVLIAAGSTKLADPVAFAQVLRELRVPIEQRSAPAAPLGGSLQISRFVGGCELLLGLCAFYVGGTVFALLISLTYFGFAVVVGFARRASLGSCGCFGARSGPPSLLHLGINLSCAAIAALGAVFDLPGLAQGLSDSWMVNALVIIGVLVSSLGVIWMEIEHA
ncbi:MAG: MauE/DoxX family redox-associated membrane protein [Microthrixaceae bacterium]